MPDIRAGSGALQRKSLERERPAHLFDKLDKRLRKWSDHFGPPYLTWSFALILFIAADAVAYGLTV